MPWKGGERVNSDPLKAALTPEQREQGFWLAEDEDFVYLYRHEKLVATFSAKGATVEAIREEADRQLKKTS